MPVIHSVNVGSARPSRHAAVGTTGIHKQPVDRSVEVSVPSGSGLSGMAGDHISDVHHHGGVDQAVYAYAWEDLLGWSSELGQSLPPGSFGENLTTSGLDVSGALIGQRWRIGSRLLLEVSCPRIPCRTFAAKMGRDGWVKTFTQRAKPGAYLRVVEPGAVRAGDDITITREPEHDVTIELAFRALTTERELLPRLLAAEALAEADMRKARAAS